MALVQSLHRRLFSVGDWLVESLRQWWSLMHFTATALVLVLAPSSYGKSQRLALARQIHFSTWQVLLGFTMLNALVSLVLIRIVVVTALSYGLSQYALEMMVRVLVLELIPLGAALFVVFRAGDASANSHLNAAARSHESPAQSLQRRHREWVPFIVSNMVAVLTLAVVSGTVALLLAYLSVYGLSPWGLHDYTRVVGRVFSPPVAIAFGAKTVLFGLAVAVVPLASALQAQQRSGTQGMVRLFFVLLVLEGASLSSRYI